MNTSWNKKRQNSFNILEKYRDILSDESYTRIVQAIGTHAMEDLFATEDDILDMIKIENKEINVEELIALEKKKWLK